MGIFPKIMVITNKEMFLLSWRPWKYLKSNIFHILEGVGQNTLGWQG